MNWIAAGSGNWDVGSNWSTGIVPGTGDMAVINTTAAGTITIQSGDNISVQSISVGSHDILAMTGGALAVAGDSEIDGSLNQQPGTTLTINGGVLKFVGATGNVGGTLTLASTAELWFDGGSLTLAQAGTANGGTILANNGAILTNNGTISASTLNMDNSATLLGTPSGTVASYLVGITIPAGSNVVLGSGASATMKGTITDDGTFSLNPQTGSNSLYFSDAATLVGTGQVTLSQGSQGNVAQVIPLGTLTIAAGMTLGGAGDVGAPGYGTVINQGSILAANGTLVISTAAVTNTGTIAANSAGSLVIGSAAVVTNNGQVILNGASLTLSSGAITGGTIQGTNGSILTNNALIAGASLNFTGGSTLANTNSSGTLNGISIPSGSDIMIPAGCQQTIEGTITNNGTIDLTASASAGVYLNYSGNVTLAGMGQLVMHAVANSGSYPIIQASSPTSSITNAVGHTVRSVGWGSIGGGGKAVNAGTLDADGGGLVVNATTATNSGTCLARNGGTFETVGATFDNSGGVIQADGGGVQNGGTITGGTISLAGNSTLANNGAITAANLGLTGGSTLQGNGSLTNIAIPADFKTEYTSASTQSFSGVLIDDGVLNVLSGSLTVNGSLQLNGSALLATSSIGTIDVAGNLLGTTQNADQYAPQGTLVLNGTGTPTAPQQLEVMSQDLGNLNSGLSNNFAYGTLALANNTYVQLVDQSHNSTGTGVEALYAQAIIVPAGCTLDLHGLHAYGRVVLVAGTVLGGTIAQLSSTGTLSLNVPSDGSITAAAPSDSWTFFGHANQTITVVVNTGSVGSAMPPSPGLNFAQVQLLDPNGKIVATGSNTQSGADADIMGVALPADGTYTLQVQAPAGHGGNTGNYLITVWNAPVANNALVLGQAANGQLVTPYAVDQWGFFAVANEQIKFNLLAVSIPGIVFDLTGPGGSTVFSGATASSSLITLPSAGGYVLTAHWAQPLPGESGSYSFRIDETPLSNLAPGTIYQEVLLASGQAQLFTLTLTNSTTVSIHLTDGTAADENEIYVSLASAPTRDTYQFRTSTAGADQSMVFAGQPGTYYILVYNNLVAAPGGNYMLLVQDAPFGLVSLTPSQIATSQPTTLLVNGVFPLAYTSATAYHVQFIAGNTTYPSLSSPLYLAPSNLGISTSTGTETQGTITMSATLPANLLPAGAYSVRVIDALGDIENLPNALTVTAGGTGVLKTSITAPNPIGNHQPAIIEVTYSNVGTAPLNAPLLVLDATRNGAEGAFLSLDPALAGLGYYTNTTPAGFSPNVQFLASGATPGVLEPGESVTVAVYYAGWLESGWGPPITFSVGELDTTNTQTIDWNSIGAGLRPGSINTAAWNAIFPTVQANLGATWGSYVQVLDGDAVYLASIGEPTNDLSQLLSFEIEKANAAYTAQTLTSATADSLPAPGMDLTFVQSYQQPISGRYTQGILGFGWTTNWDISAQVMLNGDVAVKNDGISLYFSLRPNGSFKPQSGDQGTTLTVSNGAYVLAEPDGTVYQFNAAVNNLATLNFVEDTHGNKIACGYTGGQLTSLTDSNGQSFTLSYTNGVLTQLKDSNGQVATYSYDPTNQYLLSFTNAESEVTKYTYFIGANVPASELNALQTITNAAGTVIIFAYDSQGRLSSQTLSDSVDSLTQTETWSYLSPGGYTITDANNNASTVLFNLFGATAETIDPLGNITRDYYDSNLNLVKVIGPQGATYTYSYDRNGNLLTQTDPLGLTLTFTYNAQNDLTSSTDAKGNTTAYAYDSQNDLLSITYANGTQQQYSYNPLGQAKQFLNAKGQAIAYTYNNQGLVTKETFADQSSYSYTYDARGNLLHAVGSQGTTSFQYKDPHNPDLLTEVDYPDGITKLNFTYNAIGQRTQSVDQSGFTVNYIYDALGRLSRLTDANGNLIVQYTYDAAGNLVQKDMGNGTRTVYTYFADGNVQSITNYAPDHKTINSFDRYTYDPLGNVLTDTNQDGQWVYTYDAASFCSWPTDRGPTRAWGSSSHSARSRCDRAAFQRG